MKDTIIQITNNGMGKADEILQHKLIGKYLELIQQNDSLPNAICFYTDGVKLVVEGSPVLEQLKGPGNQRRSSDRMQHLPGLFQPDRQNTAWNRGRDD